MCRFRPHFELITVTGLNQRDELCGHKLEGLIFIVPFMWPQTLVTSIGSWGASIEQHLSSLAR
ncbi:Protein kinase domain-containing protein [Psidium guajava]|nr:Protein kinase domain-containing protein [Psidium guajava]